VSKTRVVAGDGAEGGWQFALGCKLQSRNPNTRNPSSAREIRGERDGDGGTAGGGRHNSEGIKALNLGILGEFDAAVQRGGGRTEAWGWLCVPTSAMAHCSGVDRRDRDADGAAVVAG